jgi:formylglycine-generating enzyme required for sulfatase activity
MYDSPARHCRAAWRDSYEPDLRVRTTRIARSVRPEPGDIDTDAVVYYPFDVCAGTSPEALGTGHDVTLAGDASCEARDALSTALGTRWSSGTALALDGIQDNAVAPDDPIFEPAQFTLSAWIYSDDYWSCGQGSVNEPCTIVSKGNTEDPAAGYWFHVNGDEDGDGTLSLVIAGSGGETHLPGSWRAVSASTWHHVVATFDGSWARIYLNGVLHGFQYVTHGIDYGAESFLVGNLTNREFEFNGLIDEVALWDYAMSEAEVAALYTVCDGSPTCPRGDCFNDTLDPGESDVDCGGICGPCRLGRACRLETDCPASADCANGHCAPKDYAYIPAGSFWMGSPDGCPISGGYPGDCRAELGRGDDESLHEVTLSSPFYLAHHEVTQAEWWDRMGTTPWEDDCPNCPVNNVNWWEALAYANALSAAEELPLCYVLYGCTGDPGEGMTCTGVVVIAGDDSPYLCGGYRLPMEAEWEYAYRARTTSAFYNGEIYDSACSDVTLDAIGWYCGNSPTSLQPVGLKPPNGWDLYDMAGNVGEWVWDVHGDYPASSITDPEGPETGDDRVSRGGGAGHNADHCRAAHRGISAPDGFGWDLGFRVARSELRP